MFTSDTVLNLFIFDHAGEIVCLFSWISLRCVPLPLYLLPEPLYAANAPENVIRGRDFYLFVRLVCARYWIVRHALFVKDEAD